MQFSSFLNRRVVWQCFSGLRYCLAIFFFPYSQISYAVWQFPWFHGDFSCFLCKFHAFSINHVHLHAFKPFPCVEKNGLVSHQVVFEPGKCREERTRSKKLPTSYLCNQCRVHNRIILTRYAIYCILIYGFFIVDVVSVVNVLLLLLLLFVRFNTLNKRIMPILTHPCIIKFANGTNLHTHKRIHIQSQLNVVFEPFQPNLCIHLLAI